MLDVYKIYDKAARLALTELCWRELNTRKIPLAEREMKQRRVLIFGDTGDVKYLDGLQNIMPLYDAIAEHDPAVATALEHWVKATAPPPPLPGPWPPVERPEPTFRRNQKVRVTDRSSLQCGETGYVARAELEPPNYERETVWVVFGLGESATAFQDFRLEAA